MLPASPNWGEVLPPLELERVASRLAESAQHVAVTPVRLVKSVGDAVMLMCFDPAPLLRAILDLADDAAANGLPRLRIGVASGLAITRGGDWFGSPVNVASRVTAAARPGTVAVADSTREAVGNAADFTWSSMGARRLKGVSGKVKALSGSSAPGRLSNRLHRLAYGLALRSQTPGSGRQTVQAPDSDEVSVPWHADLAVAFTNAAG